MPPKKRYKMYLVDDGDVPKTSTWRNQRRSTDLGMNRIIEENNRGVEHQPEEQIHQPEAQIHQAREQIHQPQEQIPVDNAESHEEDPFGSEDDVELRTMDIDDGHNCGGSGTSEDHESETGANDCDAANDGEREEMRQAQTGKFTNNSKPNPSNNRPRVLHEELIGNINLDDREIEADIPQINYDFSENGAEEINIEIYLNEEDFDNEDGQQQENMEDQEADQQQENRGGQENGQQQGNNKDHEEEVDHQQQGNGEHLENPNPTTHSKLRQAMLKEEFTSPILRPVNASPAETLLMTLQLAEQNHFTFKAFVDSVKLVNSIFISPVLPNSSYLLDTLLNSSEGLERYFYCSECSFSFGNRDSATEPVLVCPECGHSNEIADHTKASYFVLYLLGPQMELLFMNEEVRKNLSTPKQLLEKCVPNLMKDMYDGQCYKKFVASLPEGDLNAISLIVSTDGSPLFKSSNFSIWPFFVSINELPPLIRMKNLLLGGLWFGNKKPHMDLYLDPLVNHLKQLEAGFLLQFGGERILMHAYTLGCCVDSGARGPVQGLNTHSGYYSCNWCEIPGEYLDKVVFPFPEVPPKLRTHESVKEQARECLSDDKLAYVYGVQYWSPFGNLSQFDIVNGMVLDYAHNVPFGIARTLLTEWLTETGRGSYIGAPSDLIQLDKKMMSLKPPIEIRKPVRKITDHAHWSAREFENWTLIYSLPVLTEILPLKYLNHWSYLVQAMFLLSRQEVSHEDVKTAHKLLLHFARDAEVLYGKSFMSYNIHILCLHMAENVLRWGPAWAVSTFCFEAGIKVLKSIIHAQHGVPHQIHRAIQYKEAIRLLKTICQSQKIETFQEIILANPNKKTKYLPTADCVLVGSPSAFEPTQEEKYLIENYSEIDIEVLELVAYNKLITGRCVYTTENMSSGKKTNNSCATTQDRKVVVIKKIIYDKSSDKVILLCVEALAEVVFRFPQGIRIAPTDHCLRIVTSVGERLSLLPVTNLKIVNALTKMNDKLYVSEFSNVFNVF